MNTSTRSMVGIALAVGATYLLDPTSGQRRRQALLNQFSRMARNLDLRARDARQHAAERVQALVSRASRTSAQEPKSDRWMLRQARRTVKECAARPREILLCGRWRTRHPARSSVDA